MATKGSDKLFPIVSIGPLSQKYINGDASLDKIHDDADISDIFTKITDAFTKWGFVYLVDHGIDADEVSKTTREFFAKEKSFKSQFVRSSNNDNWGYVPFKLETFDKSRPFDLKECFNFTTPHNLADESKQKINEFMEVGLKFREKCQVLATMLLHVLNPAVDKEDKNFLISKHQHLDNINLNPTTLRLLYYPSIKKEEDILEKQLRCGEHSDYGTITLLFQDAVGGLQVVSPTDEYVDAVPVPGSIVVNVGDMMEIWTSGKFKSTRHRVLIQSRHDISRQSIAYFVHPDKDIDVSCIDGSGKFKTVNSFEYLMKKFGDSYD